MASVRRSTLQNLVERMLDEAEQLPFDGVVRVLQELHPDYTPLGYDGPARTEAVRFTQNPSLGFSSGDISSIDRKADDGAGFRGFEVMTNFLGLAGVDSPLPSSYIEEFQHDVEDNELVIGLLNIFHHRIVSLLARSSTKYQHNRTYRADGSDNFSARLAQLAGGNADEELDDGLRVSFADVFMRQASSESEIEGILQSWFRDVAIQVNSCVPRWIQIPEDQRLRLNTCNHQLGVDAVIGEFVRDASSTFEVKIGPLTMAQFNEFLPSGTCAKEMRRLLAQADVDGLSVRVQLILDDDVQPMQIFSDPEKTNPENTSEANAALGWSSWLAGDVEKPTTVTYTWEFLEHD